MSQTIYLDHNIIDALIKNKIKTLDEFVKVADPIFVYSKETLNEIRRSSGWESQFLDQLFLIEAKFLEIGIDFQGHVTDEWAIGDSDPHRLYQRHDEALSQTLESSFGLDELMSKFYGGAKNLTFTDIASSGADDLEKMLGKVLAESVDEFPESIIEVVREELEIVREKARKTNLKMGEMLDAAGGEANVEGWQSAVGVGPLGLKNIKPPNIVNQVWEAVSCKSTSLPDSLTIDQMFGLDKSLVGGQSPRNNVERCNAIYHALNYLGYYRDKNMKKVNRVIASSSDMSHVGYASLCDHLITDDLGLVMKAKATYEYLEISTEVIYADL